MPCGSIANQGAAGHLFRSARVLDCAIGGAGIAGLGLGGMDRCGVK
ncbi:hypothetical protein A11S_2307 [Micavibrio aeruginosavorus EPB]|uniref:Uncharacterized protein n=1 Tax=Micavibrio aeruginosavorus EPB TaxID=349215 RepID=M4VI97_9BACT|nr:hypothetical protein A11S_2307 [Micavibrio aeruginosavorus EPB]